MERHGGNLRKLALAAGKPVGEILDFSANINPLGPPEGFRSLISARTGDLVHYPDPDCTDLVRAFAERYGVAENEILMGNGSMELLYLLPQLLGKRRALIPVPAYADYERAAELAGLAVERLPLREEEGFAPDLAVIAAALQGDEVVLIGRPNNPTGHWIPAAALRDLAACHPQTVFVIDEAFADFVPEAETLIASGRPENIIILKSLTKFYAMPGLRLGGVVAAPERIRRLRDRTPPWSVNTLAQAVGAAGLRDTAYAEETLRFVRDRREELFAALRTLPGLIIYPGTANFLLLRSDRGNLDAPEIAQRLLADGIAIRVCENFAGLDRRFFRIAVRTETENNRLLGALRKVLGIANKKPGRRRTPAIMFQGTGSSAGKSIIAAAMCRILLQDGFRVAPFKAQNMSLNSYVTRDGLEMGRAQVVQAQACCLDPEVRMNPVLLKPMSDMGCQVIVNGRPVGNMSVSEYVAYKPTAWQAVCRAYDALLADYDGIILEGAGSPGEVNLKHHDIVNMRMAQYAQAPVLLVGDIDRGGVFASFIGTMEVLSDWERNLIAGFVVNRFRGKRELLEDGLTYTRDFTNRPVLGVIPYLHPLGLPEEDSVSYKAGLYEAPRPTGEHVEIALIDLPHISNFTDFEPFLGEPDVHLRVIRTLADLEKNLAETAVVVLPGSKNVINDLGYLKQTGLADCIKRMADQGIEIVGICGGFQMLGNTISDPHGLESGNNALVSGLGLLNLVTVLEQDKTLTRQTGVHQPSGLPVYGYEIHHGQSTSTGRPVLRFANNDEAGAATPNDLIWGSYLHGIFDADQFRRWFIDRLRQRRGLQPVGKPLAIYDLEPAFDRLAETVRGNMDMNTIYRLLGL